MEPIIVLITSEPGNQANKIIDTILQNRMAAGVNVVESVKTLYIEEGDIVEGKETLLIFRSIYEKSNQIKELVCEINSEIEVSIIHLEQLNPIYLSWIGASISK